MVVAAEIRTEGCAPERRRVLRVVQLINLGFLAVDLLLRGWIWPVVGGRLLISATLLALDRVLGSRARPPALRAALAAVAPLLSLGFGLLALGSGGAASPYQGFLAFLPIVVGILVPDEPIVAVAIGAADLAAALPFFAGRPPAELGFLVIAHGSCTFYGAVSAALYRRMRAREHAAWVAEAEAAAALARSEVQRAAVERAAAVGRIAAELGHELSGPAAAVAANLRYLEQELQLAGDGELRAAVLESRQAMERVGRVVSDLRVLTPGEAWNGDGVDLLRAVEHGLRLASLRLGGSTPVARRLPPGLPPVRASPHLLSQVVSILVGLLADAEAGAEQPLALDVAVEGDEVRLVLTGTAGAPAPPRAECAGVGLALCRELAEPWGGRIEAQAAGGGRVQLALTLRSAAPAAA